MILVGIALAALTGCGFKASATPAQTPVALHGTVRGGQQPIGGSSIQLYASGTNAPGSAADPLLDDPVQSDNDSNFFIPASYRRPSVTAQVYVVASGGNAEQAPGASNPALRLMALLGSCGALSTSSSIDINEVRAVGSVWPIATYMKSPSEIGSAPNNPDFLTAKSNASQFTGIATFNNLTVSEAGVGRTLSATSSGLTSATSTRITISQPSTPPITISVTLTPSSVTLKPLQTQNFTASVSGKSNQSIAWSLSPSEGNISASGLYTAPAAVPSSATVTITATSVSDPANSASATVTLVPPQAAGYSLAWQDTFSTLSLCSINVPGCNWYNPGIWNYSGDGVITDPSGTYVNLNWMSTQGSNYTNMTTESSNGAHFRSWTFGYIEVSMAFNPATGNWPALWMLPIEWNQSAGANYSNGLPYGELDLFEWFSDHPTLGHGTVHVWENNSDIANNYGANTWPLPAGTILSNFNTYGVLWTPRAISWYFNNQLVETFSTAGAHFNAVFAGKQSYALILSEQSGCNGVYGGCSADTLSSPLNMRVQWVHVYIPPATAP